MGGVAGMDWRPSAALNDLLRGRVAWRDADPAIRSWAMLTIYHAARTILAAPKQQRKAMLAKLPPSIRPVAEKEIIRLHRLTVDRAQQ